MSSLASVHCTVPRVRQVGASTSDMSPTNDDDFIGGIVVVVGGLDYAIFAAR